MAVDGILRFDTKIDTDGFRSGTKEISSKMLDFKIHIFNKLQKIFFAQRLVLNVVNFKKFADFDNSVKICRSRKISV